MAKYIGYAVSMCLIRILLKYLNKRDNKSKNPNEDDCYYIVKIPAALKYVYLTAFGFGLFMFLFFLYFYLKGNPTVTIGHLNFSIIFASIGLAVAVWAERWRIIVKDNHLEIHRLFHYPQKIIISEIGKTVIEKKQQLTLYDANGKKLLTVDALSDNYERLLKTLKDYNVQIKSNV